MEDSELVLGRLPGSPDSIPSAVAHNATRTGSPNSLGGTAGGGHVGLGPSQRLSESSDCTLVSVQVNACPRGPHRSASTVGLQNCGIDLLVQDADANAISSYCVDPSIKTNSLPFVACRASADSTRGTQCHTYPGRGLDPQSRGTQCHTHPGHTGPGPHRSAPTVGLQIFGLLFVASTCEYCADPSVKTSSLLQSSLLQS